MKIQSARFSVKGVMNSEKEAQMKRWVENFEELLNRPPPIDPSDIIPARTYLPINCETQQEKGMEVLSSL